MGAATQVIDFGCAVDTEKFVQEACVRLLKDIDFGCAVDMEKVIQVTVYPFKVIDFGCAVDIEELSKCLTAQSSGLWVCS